MNHEELDAEFTRLVDASVEDFANSVQVLELAGHALVSVDQLRAMVRSMLATAYSTIEDGVPARDVSAICLPLLVILQGIDLSIARAELEGV